MRIVEMKISSHKTKVLHLSRNSVLYSLQVGGVSLKQVEKLLVTWVAFVSDGRQNQKLNVQSGKASAVMRALHHSVVSKRKQSKKTKLSVLKSIFVPILTYGHMSFG